MSAENEIDSAVMALGKNEYALCAACHGQQGEGANGNPPLAQSEWVLGPPENLIKIQFRGLQGEISVKDKIYNLPGMGAFGSFKSDEEVAAVLTYVRNQFGNSAPAISPAAVKALRGEIGKPPITVAELTDPYAAILASKSDEPAPILAAIPSTGIGAPTIGLVTFLLIGGLSLLGSLRMKAANK